MEPPNHHTHLAAHSHPAKAAAIVHSLVRLDLHDYSSLVGQESRCWLVVVDVDIVQEERIRRAGSGRGHIHLAGRYMRDFGVVEEGTGVDGLVPGMHYSWNLGDVGDKRWAADYTRIC